MLPLTSLAIDIQDELPRSAFCAIGMGVFPRQFGIGATVSILLLPYPDLYVEGMLIRRAGLLTTYVRPPEHTMITSD